MVTIELTEDDAWADGELIDYGDGTLTLERIPQPYEAQSGDTFYPTVEGDTYDTLSYAKYQNSKLWHKISDANDIINPFDALPDNLILPDLSNA